MEERIFQVNLQLTTKNTISLNDSFELSDSGKWDLLRAHAAKVLKKSALNKFPTAPPAKSTTLV